MNYTLHQLQVFLKVAELKSITKASEALHLSQPAVSIQLKNLQEQFEIPLIEVIGRQVYVTEFGREIAEASQKIVEQVHAINFKTMSYRDQLVGHLNISIVSTGKYVMPYFLSGFVNKHEGVELNMDVTNKLKVLDSLEQNHVDFALVSTIPSTFNVNKIELMPNSLFWIGNCDKVFKNKTNNLTALKKLPFIFREHGSATRHAMEAYMKSNDIKNTKRLELTSNEAVKQAVIAGLGFSMMPIIGIRKELSDQDLQIIPMKGTPITTTWNLVWLKSKRLSPVAEAFVKYISNSKTELINQHFSWYQDFLADKN
ncbi:DNA-binding transcriptional regulator, LysR family [Psychroflexus salarius]|uniref:DNA-binding transcriptional regulator, LysR family n=1 Tax=Psychroflexus salarius TaxID=1155689 RepID=A0A1M4SRE8_9FLAO|nr:LysR family transcriptional regulator [Psychroflexus salarius]SHE34824.1 DNA-binding transcriptional regulator, LysR family [Psychroflexus salarius]